MGIVRERIIEARESAGYNRKDFADLLGIPYRTITNYENGSREPGMSYLVAVANFLGISTDYLSGVTNDPCRKNETISDEDPQIKQISESCVGLTSQALTKIQTYVNDLRYNPENFKQKKSLTLEPSSMREKGRAVARGGVVLEQEHPIDEDAFLRAIAESEPPKKV